ncbi:MAG TPA: TIR domain-containing protein [Longimicrobiales bacterium]|nr:TIR domain-containing protein [Longimicrobiales bacterium]
MSTSDDNTTEGPFDDSPAVETATEPAPGQDVFISYSSIDRARVNGLRELLIGLNKDVFQDHISIPAGRRWRAELDKGITRAGTLVLFWTKNSAASDPVRMEYEWFASNRRERPLIPILGDHTPLPPILAERQAANLLGPGTVVNEVLETKRNLEADGVPANEVMERVEARLEELGVKLDSKQRQKFVFLFLGFSLKEILRRYWAEALKQLALLVVGKVWRYRRDITMLTYATVMAVAVVHIFPSGDVESGGGDFPIPDADAALLARIDSEVDSWNDIADHFDTISVPAGDATPVDLASLERAIETGVDRLSEQHDRTQALLRDTQFRLASPRAGDAPGAGDRLDSLFLAALYRNGVGIESTGRGVARLQALLRRTETPGDEVDLGPIQRDLSEGFLETYALIESVRGILGGRTVAGPGPVGGLSREEVQRVVQGELRGARDTLALIYGELAEGRPVEPEDPGVAPEGPGPLDLSAEVRRIDSLSAVQQDTIREILARLRDRQPPVPPSAGIVRTVRIYLPLGSGEFVEPKIVCAGEAPCADAALPYEGGATQMVRGDVTVMARISASGTVDEVTTVSVRPTEDEMLPELARRIVEGWTFEPGTLDERAAEVQMFAILVFVP